MDVQSIPVLPMCFYSFWSQPSSRQHLTNVTFFQLKCMLMVFFICFVYLLILLVSLVWNVLANQKRFLYINICDLSEYTRHAHFKAVDCIKVEITSEAKNTIQSDKLHMENYFANL